MNYAKYIDHTLLKPEATKDQIDKLISEAKEYNFKSICINPTHVQYAAEQLTDSDVLVCTVIGFPLEQQQQKLKSLKLKMSSKRCF